MIAAPRCLTIVELQKLEQEFQVVAQLRCAPGNRERARTLLQLPDQVLMTKAEELATVCSENAFPAGADFIAIRVAALNATRQLNGELPKPIQDQLNYWRSAFVMAAGARS